MSIIEDGPLHEYGSDEMSRYVGINSPKTEVLVQRSNMPAKLEHLTLEQQARMYANVEERNHPYDERLAECMKNLAASHSAPKSFATEWEKVRQELEQPEKPVSFSWLRRKTNHEEVKSLGKIVEEKAKKLYVFAETLRDAYNKETASIHSVSVSLDTAKLLVNFYEQQIVSLEEKITHAKMRLEATEFCTTYLQVKNDLRLAKPLVDTYEPMLANCMQVAQAIMTVREEVQLHIVKIQQVFATYNSVTLKEIEALQKRGLPPAFVGQVNLLVQKMEEIDKELAHRAIAQVVAPGQIIRDLEMNPTAHELVGHLKNDS